MEIHQPDDRAREFLRVAHLYRLGSLRTEQPHPRTRRLSEWAREDLPRAVSVLKEVDLAALGALEARASEVGRLAVAVRQTLEAGGRVFLCGCGATGRLAMTLESLWRRRGRDGDRVVSFMAGGDVALVHALEGFEDRPDHGARHLEQLGFARSDLLIGCTEGGETPFVIGATERAAEISSHRPFFVYCNADSLLARHVERFRRVYTNRSIDKICLDVGPMALAGSTRMQASTVLQLAVGLALLHPEEPAGDGIRDYRRGVARADFSFLAELIARESAAYAAGHYIVYLVRDLGITVFTDTTERAPTFSLVPFDRLIRPRERNSLCYVALEDADTAEEAWLELLGRKPQTLDWLAIDRRTTADYLRGFDFSLNAVGRRLRLMPGSVHHPFRIGRTARGIAFALRGASHEVPVDGMPELFQHLLLKQVMNIHSTLVMGRLGRYHGNLMTWVTPTNNKLIDRAARYVQHLLADDGRDSVGYEQVVRRLFRVMQRTPPGESVVLHTYHSLR